MMKTNCREDINSGYHIILYRMLTNSHKAKIGVMNDEIIKYFDDENIS